MTDLRGEDVDVDVFEQADGAGISTSEQQWLALPLAGMLTIEDADALLRWRDATIVAVIGERNGGKTTLITEIYEQFLRGAFAGRLFAGSLSLLGFELKSFQSRAESGESVPDTPRTSKQDGLSFFHLAVFDEKDRRRTDLLISERAGEVYREVRDKPATASELIEPRKAHKVVFIVDGERVADGRRRAEALSSVRSVARAFIESGSLRTRAEVQLVTTKCDLLRGDSARPAMEALEKAERKFLDLYEGRAGGASVHRAAARDPNNTGEEPMGLATLLRSWITPPRGADIVPMDLPLLNDEFDRLLTRKAV